MPRFNKTIDYAKLVADAARDGVPTIAVAGVIIKYGSVLLVKRVDNDSARGGQWETPGGKVESGESLDAALVREVREETGLRVSEIREYVGSADYLVESKNMAVRLFMFAADAEGSAKVDPKEHQGYAWVKAGELEKYLTPEVFTDLLLSYVRSGHAKGL